MALPVSFGITGGSPQAKLGPFKSSAGAFYAIYKPSNLRLSVRKSTDTQNTWSDLGQNKDVTNGTNIQYVAAHQVGDNIHVAIAHGTSNIYVSYVVFNMSSETWTVTELDVVSNLVNGTNFILSIVARTSDVLIFFNGALGTSMGANYWRVVYIRRTGANTWAAAVGVDAGGATHYYMPEVVLADSDRVHFFWGDSTATGTYQRAMTSANALQTASAKNTTVGRPIQGISYNASGTQKVALVTDNNRVLYFNSGNTPTLSASGALGSSDTAPRRLYVDVADVWLVYLKSTDSDLYALKSTDHGATFGSEANAWTGTVGSGEDQLSRDGVVYQSGSNVVIPYVMIDASVLKYNEYTLRVIDDTVRRTFTSAGVGAITWVNRAKNFQTFTSAGVATGTFGAKTPITATFTIAGVGAASFASHLRQKESLTAAGAATASFEAHPRVKASVAMAGAASVTFASLAKNFRTFTSAGVASATVAAFARLYRSFTSDGVGVASFSPRAREYRSFTSAGVSNVVFTGYAGEEITDEIRATFTIAGVAAATFQGAGRSPVTLSSAGLGAASFTGFARHRRTVTAAGVGEATFTGIERHRRSVTVAGLATVAFSVRAKTYATLNAAGATVVTIDARALVFRSYSIAGSGVALFDNRARNLATLSASGVGSASFSPRAITSATVAMGGAATVSVSARAINRRTFDVGGSSEFVAQGGARITSSFTFVAAASVLIASRTNVRVTYNIEGVSQASFEQKAWISQTFEITAGAITNFIAVRSEYQTPADRILAADIESRTLAADVEIRILSAEPETRITSASEETRDA